MKRLLLFLLSAVGLAFAQGARYDSVAQYNQDGYSKVIPFATITVCTSTATQVPCTPKTNIFSDIALTVPMSNPLQADANGNFGFYIAPSPFKYTITASGFTGQTYNVTPGAGAGGATTFNGVPTGSCTASQTAVNTLTGDYYSCNNGAWLLVGPTAPGSVAFNTIQSGTNTGAAMVLGSGSSLSGTGTATVDFTALGATAFKVPVVAGAAPLADGAIAVDSTAHTLNFGSNNSTLKAAAASAAACLTHEWVKQVSGAAPASCAQPAFSDISGLADPTQVPAIDLSSINNPGGVKNILPTTQLPTTVALNSVPGNAQHLPAYADTQSLTLAELADILGNYSLNGTWSFEGNSGLSNIAEWAVTVPGSGCLFAFDSVSHHPQYGCAGGSMKNVLLTGDAGTGLQTVDSTSTATNVSSTTPAAPANAVNCAWQVSSTNASCNIPAAGASQIGVVDTTSQTFAGAKTFNSTVTATQFISSASALKLQGAEQTATPDAGANDLIFNSASHHPCYSFNGGTCHDTFLIGLDNLASIAAFSDVVNLWTSCTAGYLKFDGTCDSPAGAGTVTSSGTPTAHQVAVFTSATDIKGITLAVDQVNVGRTSADPSPTSITNCGDSTHALAYSTSTHAFSCQNISSGAGTASINVFQATGFTPGTGSYTSIFGAQTITGGTLGVGKCLHATATFHTSGTVVATHIKWVWGSGYSSTVKDTNTSGNTYRSTLTVCNTVDASHQVMQQGYFENLTAATTGASAALATDASDNSASNVTFDIQAECASTCASETLAGDILTIEFAP